MQKAEASDVDEEHWHENLAYIESNPHEAWLRETFARAGIDYGRIDYGLLGDRPQVWEINLNPTLCRNPADPARRQLPDSLARLREQVREAFHVRLRAAFAALDDATSSAAKSRWRLTGR